MRTRLMASSMISGVALAAVTVTGAQAQAAADQAAAQGTAVQELVVTGSRIPSKNLTSVSPVTTVNNQAIKLQGTTNVEDLINNLPQAFADFGQYESNGSSGTATVDLRGLGNVRTLVLIDGKRVQPGDPLTPVADLNFIPPSLIDRVDVLTGGASAVYGSDAVAGVVNFVMKHNFQGLQIDAETSIGELGNSVNPVINAANNFPGLGPNESVKLVPIPLPPNGAVWAGERNTVTITGGANSPDDKGNVEFYLGYTSIQAVLEGKYTYSTCALSTNTGIHNQQYCGGSVTAAGSGGGLLQVLSGPNTAAPPGAYFGLGYAITGTPQANGLLPAFTAADLYNFNPLNYIQRPDTRYNAGEFSHYEIAPWLDIYSSFMFLDDHTEAQIAGSGSFYGDNVYTIPCNDPLLSTAQANTLCGPEAGVAGDTASALIGRRDVEGVGRVSDITHEDYRIVIGAKGDLGSGWSYDVSMQYGRSVLTDIEDGYFLNPNLINAIDVIPNPAVGGIAGTAVGAPVCAAAVSGAAPKCVPYNIWSPGGVTQSQLNYLEGTAEFSGFTTEQVVTGNITGDLGQYGFKSPFASDGAGISVGAEYRREYLQFIPDEAAASGQLAGFGGSLGATSGSQSDKDVFGELRVPLIQNMPFAKDLTLETGYRYSNYTSGGGNSTYKVGGDWQITSDIRLRASYERAVRAPNVDELFAPSTPGLVAGADPCAGVNAQYTAAQCYNTFTNSFPHLTLAQYTAQDYNTGTVAQCISGQCGTLTAGNPDLKPEVATTKSFGFVFTPTFFRGFTFSMDYFDIEVKDAIVVLPLNVIFRGCALTDSFCNLITRDPTNLAIYGGNGLGFINQTELNAESLATKGVDVNGDYRTSLSDWHLPDYGSLDLNFTGTFVNNLTTSFPGSVYNCAGLYGTTCGTPTPKYRSQTRLSWTTPWNLTLSVQWRYLSATRLDLNSSQVALQGAPGMSQVYNDERIPDFNYFDVSFIYKFRDRYTIRGGVNNIFDRIPPLVSANSFAISAPPFGNANTYPQVFDPLGRVLFLGLTADF